jgi:hypothetical protein
MSYDLYLLKADEVGDDPAAAYERLEEAAEDEREPTPEEARRLRDLAHDLQAANPGLDLTEVEAGFFIQLGYETEQPVVIDIGADEIRMAWSFGADDPAPALAQVRLYLPVFERHGYVAYDPQLERLFDPDRDEADATDTHRYVRERMEETYGPLVAERRPWWRRLFGG